MNGKVEQKCKMATAFIVSTEYFIDPDFPVNENYMSHVICDFSGDFI